MGTVGLLRYFGVFIGRHSFAVRERVIDTYQFTKGPVS